MGALIGMMAGLGLLLIGWTFAEPSWRPVRREARRAGRLADLLARAGVEGVSPTQVVVMCGLAFALSAVVLTGVSGVPSIGVIFGLMTAAFPITVLRARAARRVREHAALWPDAVDNLSSAVRAGLSLPEALIQLGERGPEGL